jgi:hypothetical protein
MKTQIVVHLLPQEIDWFEWQSKQFKQGSYYLDGDDKVIIDVTLNLNLVNWQESSMSKEFFINKFNQLKHFWDWAEVRFEIDEEGRCQGCDDKRRDSIRSTTADNILYLDCDLIFKPETLKYMLDASKVIPEEYYILSPEIYKLWDNSWDALVNKKYRSLEPSQEYKEADPFALINIESEVTIEPILGFKFGGGWFNLLSTNLLKLTDIPDSFGPYGVDDTYVMICSDIIKQKGYKIQQYVLRGQVVAENIKYRCNPYINFISLINRQDEFRKVAEANLTSEVKTFIDTIEKKIN